MKVADFGYSFSNILAFQSVAGEISEVLPVEISPNFFSSIRAFAGKKIIVIGQKLVILSKQLQSGRICHKIYILKNGAVIKTH